jgi:hypothetical protein
LLLAPRAARKGWVGAIQIPKFNFRLIDSSTLQSHFNVNFTRFIIQNVTKYKNKKKTKKKFSYSIVAADVVSGAVSAWTPSTATLADLQASCGGPACAYNPATMASYIDMAGCKLYSHGFQHGKC